MVMACAVTYTFSMRSVELTPTPLLRPYVQLIWCFELDVDERLEVPERIAPDGIVELVLHYRTPLSMRFSGEPFIEQPASSLISQTRRFVEIDASGPTGLVSVRFRPWGAYHFFALPVSALADRLTPAAELWGRSIGELQERMTIAPDNRQRVSLVEQFLLDQLSRNRKREVESLIRGLWRSAGNVHMAEFCRQVGVSERGLERAFGSALGMSPRSYTRLARFLRACALLRNGCWRSLTDVGYQCGYFDQAHFTSDFKRLSGLTPTQFLTTSAVSFLELE